MSDRWPLDENGWRINDVGCPHDGAPCPGCLSGEKRRPRFFLVEEEVAAVSDVPTVCPECQNWPCRCPKGAT